MKTLLSAATALLAILSSITARADVKLPANFGDNMVLQRSTNVPIWGWANPGEHVRIRFDQEAAHAIVGDDGWRVSLDLSKEPRGPLEMTVEGQNKLTVKNILVGEVWICSGQSNMEMGIKGVFNAAHEIAAADHPNIRLFNVKPHCSDQIVNDLTGNWNICTPESVVLGRWTGFSAVGYFFGRELNQQLGDTPIGLIDCSWGGTVAEAWMSSDALAANPALASLLDRYPKDVKNYPATLQKYEQDLAVWQKEADADDTVGRQPRMRPAKPYSPTTQPNYAARIYNGVVAPLIPCAIAGVIWYQGEADTVHAYRYRMIFTALITNWRTKWGRGDFPFLFVQLANFNTPDLEPANNAWAELREAQTMALSSANTAMAVTIDVGETLTIHSRDKQDVGYRLALAALATVYQKNIEYRGPTYRSMSVEGNNIRVKFAHADGLLARDHAPANFAIAGKDRKFVWADAAINDDTIVVHSGRVSAPIAVRYAWAENPPALCNIYYNATGLPMAPFRTDDWPGITMGKE